MSYRRLKLAITEFENYVSDNPDVDDPTHSRLMLLRDRLIEFIQLEEQQTAPVTDSNSWENIVDVIRLEIATFEATHPELTQKLDDLITSVATAGI